MSPTSESPKNAQEALRDFRREQIVDAARILIGRHGFGRVTMARIAQTAGVSRSTLYTYFQNKHAIVDAAFQYGHRELDERIRAIDKSSSNVRATLTRMIAATFGYFDEHKAFFLAVVSQAFLGANPAPGGELGVGSLGRAFRRQLEVVLTRGIERGELRAHDVRESSLVLALTVHGAVGVRVRDPVIRVPAERAAQAVADYFIDGIAAR